MNTNLKKKITKTKKTNESKIQIIFRLMKIKKKLNFSKQINLIKMTKKQIKTKITNSNSMLILFLSFHVFIVEQRSNIKN